MRIGYNRNSAFVKARLLSRGKTSLGTNKNTLSGTKSSNVSSRLRSISEKIASASKNEEASTKQVKADYTVMENAAGSLQEHADKLWKTGDDSLFDKAKPIKKDSNKEKDIENSTLPEAELAANKEKVVTEINSFIQDYNTMVSKMNSIGGTINNLYVNHLKKYAAQNFTALKELGITQASDGTLRIDQKTLKAADIDQMQNVFGTKDGFVSKVVERSKNVEANAKSNIAALNKKSYISSSNYNRYGNLYGDYGSNGSSYHTRA